MPRTSVWREPGFKPFWAGESLSQLGAQFAAIAMPIVAVTLLHATEEQMGYLNAAETAAFLLVGLPAGAWLDRLRKRNVMLIADFVRAAAVLLVPILWLAGQLDMWHLFVIGAIVGVATVFFDVGYQSFVPVLVQDEHVGNANGALEASAQTMRLGAPAIAGLLLTIVSAPILLFVNALGFLASAIALLFVHDSEVPKPKSERRHLLVEIGEGLKFVVTHDLLRRIVASTALSNFGSVIVFTLAPILILRILGLPEWIYGVFMTVGAVGGLLGSLAARPLADRFGEGQVIAYSALLMVPAFALLPLTTVFPDVAIVLLCVGDFLFGFLVLVYNIVQVTARQRLCPKPLLGRMNASIRFVVWGVMPIGALLSGWLGGLFGSTTTIWIGVALAATGSFPLVFSKYRSMRALPSRDEPVVPEADTAARS